MTDRPVILTEEATLETAEQTLGLWASVLAQNGRDFDAGEALRVAHQLLQFRCGFLGSEKRP